MFYLQEGARSRNTLALLPLIDFLEAWRDGHIDFHAEPLVLDGNTVIVRVFVPTNFEMFTCAVGNNAALVHDLFTRGQEANETNAEKCTNRVCRSERLDWGLFFGGRKRKLRCVAWKRGSAVNEQ